MGVATTLTRLTTAALSAAVVLAAAPASAQSPASLEYPVKANYLVKFAAFVQWPPETFESAASPMAICVLGEDPFGAVLDRAAAAEVVDGHRVVVRRLSRVDARAGCNVVYLGKSREQSVAQALTALAGAPVLTVTDSVRGPERGLIHFALAGNRVRFHIDDQLAARSHLSISSRLLSLALSVRARRAA